MSRRTRARRPLKCAELERRKELKQITEIRVPALDLGFLDEFDIGPGFVQLAQPRNRCSHLGYRPDCPTCWHLDGVGGGRLITLAEVEREMEQLLTPIRAALQRVRVAVEAMNQVTGAAARAQGLFRAFNEAFRMLGTGIQWKAPVRRDGRPGHLRRIGDCVVRGRRLKRLHNT
ncbi:MAG TPA: hypothetical protein VK399_02885, partial [Longimicrobiaceae bacterium]|nr:hypothetical protein [Longimicrobiaceae bacterium]